MAFLSGVIEDESKQGLALLFNCCPGYNTDAVTGASKPCNWLIPEGVITRFSPATLKVGAIFALLGWLVVYMLPLFLPARISITNRFMTRTESGLTLPRNAPASPARYPTARCFATILPTGRTGLSPAPAEAAGAGVGAFTRIVCVYVHTSP